MIRTVAAALLLLPAACSEPTPADDAASAPAANGTDAAAIRALPVGQRNGVFFRAIRDSGAECQQVTQATEQPMGTGPATWAISCDRASRYVVAIGPDGMATVTPADALPRG